MKIKVRANDFVVQEVADFKIKKEGNFFLYILEKVNWNTLDALKLIAKVNNIPISYLSYCGKKDRYAKTLQYITSKTNLKITTINENVKLTFIGTTDEIAKPSLIQKNNFRITIRNLKNEEVDKILKRIEEIKTFGFPNYFGEQRFGSFDKNLGFFAEKFLKAQYNGALKCLLCSIHSEDNREEKDRKKLFFNHWGDFQELKKIAKTNIEKKCFDLLINKPKGFLNAIHLYPEEEISMAFSAYQSYLWNNILKKIISELNYNKKIYIKGWAYPAYRVLKDNDLDKLKNLLIPVPGIKPVFHNEDIEKIYESVLNEEGLYQARFSMRKYRKVIPKSYLRQGIVIPENLTILHTGDDEIYENKKFMKIYFSLPKGSYATTLLKTLELE